ncbi:Uncharacterised protein [Weeksella virosa]|uniref:Uncharacterized protein n=1 Tax=Weeksella virosa (strain ATCC 43766 / DSM 16922 / JCM 21250 / CCUG 30538 / CDC 9751 / IAM 14551 / NBRC 16016 / NCTC 11634 / CL345/78) TaxID=865938 RepID=F0NZR2_WEEVC|nr:hypothetical protein Weevi_0602 [Weeksella virosa DSM 16922]SUP53603.1 Uncharacterised protein [Weeksella virosa]VEH62943.1 Uncharacterised protein [Weeksella virosa]
MILIRVNDVLIVVTILSYFNNLKSWLKLMNCIFVDTKGDAVMLSLATEPHFRFFE